MDIFKNYLAGGRGFEPRFTESESVVLPLNDPPVQIEEPHFYKIS